jgi:hypothetical protein
MAKATTKKPATPARTPYNVDLLPLIGVDGAYHHTAPRPARPDVYCYRLGHAFATADFSVPELKIYVYCRHEGDAVAPHPTSSTYLGWRCVPCATDAEAAAVIAACLRTGRTVESGRGVGLREMMREQHWQKSGVDMQWDSILAHVEGRGYFGVDNELPWDLNPDYQRGPVWTERQQSLYIGHHLMGGQVFPIYMQRDSTYRKNEPEEVIDGQQRIRAICAFMRNEIPARFLHEGEWMEIRYLDMTENEQRSASMSSKVVFLDLPRAERLRFYLGANSGGTPHSEADLEKVARLLAKEDAPCASNP